MQRLCKWGNEEVFLNKILAESKTNLSTIPYNEVITMLQSDSFGKQLLDETLYKRSQPNLEEKADYGIITYHFMGGKHPYQSAHAVDIYEFINIETNEQVSVMFSCQLDENGKRATYDDVEMSIQKTSAENIAKLSKINGEEVIAINSFDTCRSVVPTFFKLFDDAFNDDKTQK